ncbi:prolipoprotein diacylglyceryl transferase [Pelagibacteraceae bacterium]|jgi:phosphatidylglycerol---prolipoprotein diacylglyceryl transferase|nr:prolipoprotein diacylglyceryl transferase [Pelagibacteraceae bacterium]MDC0530387.1 prolipoprotein diacylglyceryl transferase [Pelagibacteraceae bacterium]MDC0952519.1 prolipoprotein diacylglyceryl transferase [Pelagibacteraceae bacterium]
MFTHDLSPVLIDFGIIVIRWYSLAYIAGILIGWWIGKKIISKKFSKFNLKDFDDLITYLIISLLIGGRVGYIIFYNPKYYISHPLEMIKIWEGGMSFHGALIGIVIGTCIFSIRRKISAFFLLDIIACVSPVGLFFGRIANFINGELVGKITIVSWGVIFPSIDSLPRHPSQLYEAILEGIILFLIMNIIIFKKNYKIGTCSYMFLICYGIFRIISEFFREPDSQLGYLFGLFSMGTILSAFMMLFGFIIFRYLRKNEIKFKIF